MRVGGGVRERREELGVREEGDLPGVIIKVCESQGEDQD